VWREAEQAAYLVRHAEACGNRLDHARTETKNGVALHDADHQVNRQPSSIRNNIRRQSTPAGQ